MPEAALIHALARSAATEEFKADVRAYLCHQPASRVAVARHSPRVKVARVLTQLLSSEPTLAIDRVHVEGVSGCSDFRGVVTVHADEGSRSFDFAWCCHWKAIELGWTDAFGLPDQIRAAQEFGWECFERWAERKDAAHYGEALRSA